MSEKKQFLNNRYFLNRIFSHENKDKLAICECGNEITYRELENQVLETAKHFKQLGIQKADRILIEADQSIGFVVKYLALHYLGAVCLLYPVNSADFNADEIKERTNARYIEDFYKQKKEIFNPKSSDAFITEENDLADILFTSGTTGTKKGVMHCYSGICQAVDNITSAVGLESKDTIIIMLPLYHSNGLGTLRTCLCIGATVVLVKGISEIIKLKKLMSKYPCTGISCSPIITEWIIKTYKTRFEEIFGKLRYIEIGTAPLSPEKRKYIREYFKNQAIYINYGSTETPRAVYMDISKNLNDNSIGKVVGDYEFGIFDDKGNALKSGEIGKLGLKSKAKMTGYFNASEITENSLLNGYFLTGDLASADSEGLITLQGRIKDLIYVGGEKLYPSEIENEINKLDDVSESVCVGISLNDNQENQRVILFVQQKEFGHTRTEYEIKEYVSQKVGKYKMPESVIFLEHIPRNEMGKIDRNLLREMAKDYLKEKKEK